MTLIERLALGLVATEPTADDLEFASRAFRHVDLEYWREVALVRDLPMDQWALALQRANHRRCGRRAYRKP